MTRYSIANNFVIGVYCNAYSMALPVMEFQDQGYKIRKLFCKKIDIPKWNYWILRIGLMGSLSSLQKSEFLKLIISFFHYFWCQNWYQWHKFSKFNNFLWVCWFLCKNLSNFVYPIWKLHNPYCHTKHWLWDDHLVDWSIPYLF